VIKRDPQATSETLQIAADFKARVKAFTPKRGAKGAETESPPAGIEPVPVRSRRPKFDEVAWLEDQKLKSCELMILPDGFYRSVNAIEAVSRVSIKYGSQQPSWTDLANDELLQVALGDIPLNEQSVVQCYLSLAYDFKERLNAIGGPLALQTKWLTSAICAYARKHAIAVPVPNCLTMHEELSFRV
jgi:hypothetical protein